jgi:hypothetical protein
MQLKHLVIGLTCTLVAAQEVPKAISSELRAKFWRAQAEYISASAQAQKARATLDAAQAEMSKVCGDQQLIAGQDGEPTCQPKPDGKAK